MADLAGKILNSTKKILISVGKNNKPTYTAMAIATANGIFKPLSSLTDRKEKPEARKYAALREFVTECVAVPTYWSCGAGAAMLGAKLFKDNPEKKAMARANMMFLGVCTAAVLIIPSVCSGALWVLDEILGKNKEKQNEPEKLDIVSKSPEAEIQINNPTKFGANISRPSIHTFVNKGGLKI